MARFNDMVHNWWYNPVDWQRRTVLVLFSTFAIAPTFLLTAFITILFACIYIPFLTVLRGWDGYQEAVNNVTDVIMDPFMDLLYLMRSIWITHWDRLPEK